MQFTIRQMIGWTAGVGVVLGCLFGLPDIVSMPLMLLVLLSMPVVLIVGTIYASDWKRTFLIGALIACGPMLAVIMLYGPMLALSGMAGVDLSEATEAAIYVKIVVVGFATYGAINGGIAMLIRWLVAPSASGTKNSSPKTESPRVPDSPRIEPATLPYAVIEGRMTVETPA